MRYYILSNQSGSVVPRHIIAEVVRDVGERASERDESLAGRFAGPNVSIMTLDELLDLPDGRKILRAWDSGSDTSFYLETARMERDSDRTANRHLRLVVEDPEGDGFEKASFLIKRAALLQLQSAELVARVEGLRLGQQGMVSEEDAGANGGGRREPGLDPAEAQRG